MKSQVLIRQLAGPGQTASSVCLGAPGRFPAAPRGDNKEVAPPSMKKNLLSLETSLKNLYFLLRRYSISSNWTQSCTESSRFYSRVFQSPLFLLSRWQPRLKVPPARPARAAPVSEHSPSLLGDRDSPAREGHHSPTEGRGVEGTSSLPALGLPQLPPPSLTPLRAAAWLGWGGS